MAFLAHQDQEEEDLIVQFLVKAIIAQFEARRLNHQSLSYLHQMSFQIYHQPSYFSSFVIVLQAKSFTRLQEEGYKYFKEEVANITIIRPAIKLVCLNSHCYSFMVG